jgi:CO dehydrogenase maturation factor
MVSNATACADQATGTGLAGQVDPGFRHGPAALTSTV